uniref:Secreted protein n=1 Tax=Oryza sativa subsp. japonica TaxID=39947 RepID=Q84YN8_ORYSJ|nr:hypothetical protein [Oryza sativa Japonica Group]BAD31187.1 hypothetical protein [Oryza sativa Japonica Group]
MQHTRNQFRVCLLLCAAPSLVDYSLPFAGVHRRSEEQVSGTSAFDILHWEKAARFLGSASRDCSLFVRDGLSSCSLACCAPLSTPAIASDSCRATGRSATSKQPLAQNPFGELSLFGYWHCDIYLVTDQILRFS